jgi:hypothetical protein
VGLRPIRKATSPTGDRIGEADLATEMCFRASARLVAIVLQPSPPLFENTVITVWAALPPCLRALSDAHALDRGAQGAAVERTAQHVLRAGAHRAQQDVGVDLVGGEE